MIEPSTGAGSEQTVEWSDVGGGFAYVARQIILPVTGLDAALMTAARSERASVDLSDLLRVALEAWRRPPGTQDSGVSSAYVSWQELHNQSEIEDPPVALEIFSARLLLDLLGVATTAASRIDDWFVLVEGDFDVIAVVGLLHAIGLAAQPNHAFALHDGCCCEPHPAGRWPAFTLLGEIGSNPSQGIKGKPSQGIKGKPSQGIKGRAGSSAEPLAVAPNLENTLPLPWGAVGQLKVVVLDSGMPNISNFFLAPTTSGESNEPFDTGDNPSPPNFPSDGLLDEAGGHGGFIAGIIERLAPGTGIRIKHVLKTGPNEITDEVTVRNAIADAVTQLKGLTNRADGLITMSFGGPVWSAAALLAKAVADAQKAGAVLVASAGNDASCQPNYPAALPNVVSVGAIGPDGPADFTNYGEWVRCCAPGVDVVGKFFWKNFDAFAGMGGDPDDFKGWAMWSGTSFAVPMVAAAILRDMAYNNHTAQQAVKAIIDAPHLGRIPGLGTVVNI